jgi:ankyrin repeat protein
LASHGELLPHPALSFSGPIKILIEGLRPAWSPATVTLPEIISQFQLFVPERHKGDLSGILEQIFVPSSPATAALSSIFTLVAFLASNALMNHTMMGNFLQWVVDQEYTTFLERFLKIETPTIQGFARSLLESAVWTKKTVVIDTLLKWGVEYDDRILRDIVLTGDAGLTERVLYQANDTYFEGHLGQGLLFTYVFWYSGYPDLVRFLLAKGVDPNAKLDGATALSIAMKRRNLEAVEVLLKEGADPDLKFGTSDGYMGDEWMRPIEYGALIGWTEGVACLLVHGAEIHSGSFRGMTFVDWVALHRIGMIFELSKRGLPFGATRPALADLVDAANRGGHSLAEYIAGQPEGVKTHELERALEAAILIDHITAAITLLQHGVDPNGPTLARSPLTTASEMDDDSRCTLFLKLLLKHRANPNGQPELVETCANRQTDYEFWETFSAFLVDSKQRMSALVQAAKYGNIAAAACLLSSRLDIDTPVLCELDCPESLDQAEQELEQWLNPLQMAVKHAQEDMVLFMISRGANINAPAHPINGRTALQAALEGDCGYQYATYIRIAQLLLKRGANASAPPAELWGVTALEAYLRQSYYARNVKLGPLEGLCDVLLDAGASVSRPGGEPSWALHKVISQRWHRTLGRLLKEDVIIDYQHRDPESSVICTPTQLACLLGDLTALKMLLEHGANIHEAPACNRGRTALQAAASLPIGSEKMEIVHLLLDLGADINADPSPEYGITALQGAAIEGDLRLADLLISKGADVNAWPSIKEGRTAIEGAAEHGRLDMVRLLLNAGAIGDVIHGTGFKRAIELAEENGHFAVANVLKMEAPGP